MKFQSLPKEAQHHALSTLRELIVSGDREEDSLVLAGKVQAAFVSMYDDTKGAEAGAGVENAVTYIFNIQDSADLQSEDVISRIAQCVKSHLANVEKSSEKEHQNKAATFTPVIILNSDTLPPMFCPAVECNDCSATECTSHLQRAGKAKEAQREYDLALAKLKRAEDKLRQVVFNG